MPDLSRAAPVERRRVDGAAHPLAAAWESRMPPSARRRRFVRHGIFKAMRDTPVNPERTPIDDPAALAAELKRRVLELGAHAVGIAAYDPRIRFSNAAELAHGRIVVFAMRMQYDVMADIGPDSQDEVHRVYHALDELGIRLTHEIGAYGYAARLQPNEGDIPLVPYAALAGLGELGKHGSLISPQLGSSFRLGAVSTDMPLAADGPRDFGIDEVCMRCNVCTRFCPAGAIRDEKREVAGVLRWHVDTPACEPYFYRLFGCKVCLMVCPFNARSLKEQYRPMQKDLVAAKDARGLLALLAERNGLPLLDDERP